MKDIQTRADIEKLVNTFYKDVLKDDVIGYLFTDVAQLNWDKHMPIMYDFWETMLLGEQKYRGNPMTKHFQLNEKSPLNQEHFNRWLELWVKTVNNLFEGPTATEAVKRAETIAQLMALKIIDAK